NVGECLLTAPSLHQNETRSMNCTWRGVPVPMGVVLIVDWMIPNCAGTVMSPDGSPYCERFKTLKNSLRNSTAECSPNVMCFVRPISSCASDGPLPRFRPALPNVPGAGARKAAGFIHCVMVRPPGGISETPGTTSGLCETV